MEQLLFDSGLDENAFGKSDLCSLLSDTGVRAEQDVTGRFSFTPWSFTTVTVRTAGTGGDPHVFFCGDGFSGTPLSVLLRSAADSGAAPETKWQAAQGAAAVCDALTQAAAEQTSVPCNGAGGILCAFSGSRVSLLFLPPVLFERVCSCRGIPFYAAEQGCWISKQLAGSKDAAPFTCAVVAYNALTGHLPFAAEDESARNADIDDRNYLRLEHAVNGVSEPLAAAVDAALDRPALVLAQKKKRNAPPPAPLPSVSSALLRAELGLTGTPGILSPVNRPDALPPEQFQAKVTSYYKMKEKKVQTARNIRRNTALIIGMALAAAVVTAIGLGQKHDNGSKPTSRGLTSTQTAEAFYQGIQTQNVEQMGCVSKGRSTSQYSDSVSQIYVVSKTRAMYSAGDGIVTPEKWIALRAENLSQSTPKPFTIGAYGLTCFTLDGNDDNLAVTVPTVNMKPQPVTAENGTPLADGMTAVHTAQYYIVHTEDEENNFYAERHTDTVTLTYRKSRWLVTDIRSAAEEVPVAHAAFASDLNAALARTPADPAAAVASLRNTYPWLPREAAVRAESDRIAAENAKEN